MIVQPAPVIVQQPTVVQPPYPPPAQDPRSRHRCRRPPRHGRAAAARCHVQPTAATTGMDRQSDIDACVQQLRAGDEQIAPTRSFGWADSSRRAVGPMVKALNSDGSPKVREAAARGWA